MDWKDVTIRKWQQLHPVINSKRKDKEKQIYEVLSILHGKPEEHFERWISVKELGKLIADAKFVFTTPTYDKVNMTIKYAGKKLVIESKPSDLIGGQYIDLASLCKPEVIENNYHKIIATLASPYDTFGNKYKRMIKKGKTKEELIVIHERITEERGIIAEELLDNLTMDRVFAITNYFFLLYQNLIKATQDCLELKRAKAMKELNQVMSVQILDSIGDGA